MTGFSRKANRLLGQEMFQVKEIADKLEREGKKLIHFEIGDTCYKVPLRVKLATLWALLKNKTHYSSSYGLLELREKIARKYGVRTSNVIICPANMALFMSLSILCNPKNRVKIPNPGFPSYSAIAKYLGLKVSDDKPKVEIVNFPNNPTGECKIIKTKGKWVIYDNAYDKIQFGGEIEYRIGHNKIDIFSFSKTHAMPGYRIGYMIGPKNFIDKCARLMETTWSCMPEFLQYGALKALDIEDYKLRDLKLKKIYAYEKMRSAGYELEEPKGGIYLWVKSKYGDGSKDFKELLDKGIVVCPGKAFGKKEYFRLCYAKKLKDLVRGMNKICEL